MREVHIAGVVSGAAPDHVFAAVTDVEAFPAFCADVQEVRVDVADGVRRSAWKVHFRGGTLEWLEQDELDPVARTMTFRRIEGDFKEFHGQLARPGPRPGLRRRLRRDLRPRHPGAAHGTRAARREEPPRHPVGGPPRSVRIDAPARRRPVMTEPLDQLSSFLEAVSFPAGTIIFREGEPTDSFLVIDRGEVRLEVHSDEVDSDATLAFAGPGALLGEIGVLTGAPRSASAIAHTDVEGRRMMVDRIEWLYRERPAEGVALARMLGEAAALRVRSLNQQHEEHLFVDRGDPAVDRMVAHAVEAQRAFERWDEDRLDALLLELASTIADRADDLAAATIAETGIGRTEDKAEKIRFGALGVYASLTGRPASGLLDVDEDLDVARYASPAGVIFAMAPVTEPVSTYVNKVLISLKGRNALILSPHRASAATAAMADDLVQSVLRTSRRAAQDRPAGARAGQPPAHCSLHAPPGREPHRRYRW